MPFHKIYTTCSSNPNKDTQTAGRTQRPPPGKLCQDRASRNYAFAQAKQTKTDAQARAKQTTENTRA
eukprot:scaffold215500_cov18-Tisochrysis_lutea.AAC.1